MALSLVEHVALLDTSALIYKHSYVSTNTNFVHYTYYHNIMDVTEEEWYNVSNIPNTEYCIEDTCCGLLHNRYTGCPRRKGQYSGRSQYRSF